MTQTVVVLYKQKTALLLEQTSQGIFSFHFLLFLLFVFMLTRASDIYHLTDGFIIILVPSFHTYMLLKKFRTVNMKSNEAYGAVSVPEIKSNEAYDIFPQETFQQPNENDQMLQLSQSPIISPHSDSLSPPTMHQSGNDASYTMVTVKEDGFDESYENVEPNEEHLYEMVEAPQSPSEYDEPRMENVHANT